MSLKENDLIKLKNGDRITLRNGDVLVYDEYYGRITNSEDSRLNYKDDLTHKSRKELDIIEVKRPIEYTTVFNEEDRIEKYTDEEIDEILYRVENELRNSDKKVTDLTIKL